MYIQKSLIPIEKIPIPSILAFYKESSSTKKNKRCTFSRSTTSFMPGRKLWTTGEILVFVWTFFFGNIIKVDRKLEVILLSSFYPVKKLSFSVSSISDTTSSDHPSAWACELFGEHWSTGRKPKALRFPSCSIHGKNHDFGWFSIGTSLENPW